MFAGSGLFDQACSKLQIDAEQSAISFRQEDRQTWSSGRDSRPQVENSAVTRLTLDKCGIGKIMSPRMIDGADRRPGSDGSQTSRSAEV